LRTEALEPRRLLAGDVSAVVSHGTLLITGDNANNFVEVFGTGTAGQFVVEGFTDNQGVNTKINHSTNQQTFNGVTNISVAMNKGDDFFGFEGGNVAGNFNIDMGDGNDEVNVGTPKIVTGTTSTPTVQPLQIPTSLSSTTICGTLCINLGSGNNWLIEASTHVKQSETITACDGNDQIQLVDTPDGMGGGSQTIGNGVTVDKDLSVNLGGGSNYLEAYDLTVNGSFKVNGTGTNDVELAVVNVAKDAVFNLCGNGSQDFSIAPEEEWGVVSGLQNHVGGNLTVNTGNCNDEVDEASLTVDGTNTINTNGGNDKVNLGASDTDPADTDYSVNVGKDFCINLGCGTDSLFTNEASTTTDNMVRVTGTFSVVKGSGNSTIDLRLVTAGALKVTTDGGQDNVTLNTVDVVTTATVNLGAGNDSLTVESTTITTSKFDGGTGVNTYYDLGGNDLVNLTKRHFT
jgi:hypothetical protein